MTIDYANPAHIRAIMYYNMWRMRRGILLKMHLVQNAMYADDQEQWRQHNDGLVYAYGQDAHDIERTSMV